MDENKNPIKKRLSEQLPSHSPDPGTWQNLASRLDAMDAETAFHQKLDELPVHSPNPGTWSVINSRLNRVAYFKTAARIALSAAAGLLLFFTVSRITDNYRQSPTVPLISQQQPNKLQAAPAKADDLTAQLNKPAGAGKNNPANATLKVSESHLNEVQNISPPVVDNSSVIEEKEIALNPDMPLTEENITDPLAQSTSIVYEESLPANTISNADAEPQVSIMLKDQQKAKTSAPVKYYSPKEPKTATAKNHFALGMNYLPENIDNGTNTSVFHNVDLTASYNKEKVRFNTSLGMAYNEEDLVFDMNYDIRTPMTAPGPSGQLDTIGYNVATMESQYQGTEKHQYITYNLGLGKRLFSVGKFSTWINAGAGFGIQVNNPDLIASTERSIKGQYNALITSVSSDKPVYNDVNVNFVTGLDLNYKLLNRLSISFAPTSIWYFKPYLTKDNQPTDELSLGFKTGMKFDF
jgi:hypothetical protein